MNDSIPSGGSSAEPSSLVRNVQLGQPSAKALQEMPVRRSDWRRVRNQVQGLGKLSGGTVALNIALWFFASALTCFVTVLVLPDDVKKEHEVMEALFWAATVGFAALGAVSLGFHFTLKGRHKEDVKRICDDMDRMETDYEWGMAQAAEQESS